MNLYEFGPIAALLDGAYALLDALAGLLAPLAGLLGTDPAGLAVIALTLVVRLLLIPVGVAQARAQRTARRLAPRLAELRRRHGTDPQRLQRETMALYAAEGASPLRGCLPLLTQAPVLSLVYGLFILPTVNGHPNALLAQSFFGAPLGTSLAHAVTTAPILAPSLVVGGALLAVIAAVALLSRHRMLRAALDTPVLPAGVGGPDGGVPGLAPGVQRMLSWLPLVTVVIAAFVPLAAALYLAVTTAWTLGERELLRHLIR